MESFLNADGKPILLRMVKGIQDNKAYLGEVDGLIGDGDHGMNMNKGFSLFEKRYADSSLSFSEGLNALGIVLLNEIGGSMGPIYGTVLMDMADSMEQGGAAEIGPKELAAALNAGLEGLYDLVGARVGDKTLVDTLEPATKAMRSAAERGVPFAQALQEMKCAAEQGRDSTRELVAKYGRSSRLGERSRGVLDAGACSCCIILTAMADGILALLQECEA